MTLQEFWGFDDTVEDITVLDCSGADGNYVTGRGGHGQAVYVGRSGSIRLKPRNPVAAGQEMVWGSAVIFAVNNTGSASFARFTASDGSTVHIYLKRDDQGYLYLYAGNGTVLVKSGAPVFLEAQSYWSYLEVKATIGTSGHVEVRYDMQLIMTYNGNTQNGADGTVGYIGLSSGLQSNVGLDDSYLLTTDGVAPFNNYLGDVAVKMMLPNGNGAPSQFTNSAGTSVNNYSYVNEVNSNSSAYVDAAAAALTDLYTLAPLPVTDTPLAIEGIGYVAKSDAGTPPNLAYTTRGANGTNRTDSPYPLSTTYQSFPGTIYTTDPDGTTLTAAALNNMQIGLVTS